MNYRGLKKAVTPEYLRQMTKERGRQVITAGGRGEQVIEKPEWGHSAFTRNLLKGLGDELVTLKPGVGLYIPKGLEHEAIIKEARATLSFEV